MTTSEKIKEVLAKQVAEVLPDREGLSLLMAKKKIRLYLGVDPTSPYLHLGHAVLLRKLRQFQELGHEVIFLFGTFTAQIGDPSGRDKTREPLTASEIKKNMATYMNQVAKVFGEGAKKIRVMRNGDWLSKMKFKDVLELASHMTVSRLLERDMFQERFKRGGEVWGHELLYPLMQGYDSVAMEVDLEVGGTDQTFNMLVGRKLVQDYQRREKYVLTAPLLLGPDGRKMSKSLGNVINLLDTPNDMFGKVMTVKDELILHYAELCTDIPKEEILAMETSMREGRLNPRDAKARLAEEIVRGFHGAKAAGEAAEEFTRVFSRKELPRDIPSVALPPQKTIALSNLLVFSRLASSKSDAKRLVEHGGVRYNQTIQQDPQATLSPKKGDLLQVGKLRIVTFS